MLEHTHGVQSLGLDYHTLYKGWILIDQNEEKEELSLCSTSFKTVSEHFKASQ